MFIQKKKFTAALEFMACIKHADVDIVLKLAFEHI